jgi:hypothetical protein
MSPSVHFNFNLETYFQGETIVETQIRGFKGIWSLQYQRATKKLFGWFSNSLEEHTIAEINPKVMIDHFLKDIQKNGLAKKIIGWDSSFNFTPEKAILDHTSDIVFTEFRYPLISLPK